MKKRKPNGVLIYMTYEDAAFIARACNAHAALVNALELADAWAGNGQLCVTPADVVQEKIQAALKLARGE